MRRLLTLAMFALIITLAHPCVGAQGQQIKNPETLVIQQADSAETLDPAQAYDTASSSVFLWNIYETLIFFEGGRTDRYVPMLAAEVPSIANGGISPDGKAYTFKIRRGVKFHDGSTMTPEDVKYSLMRFMLTDPDGGPAWIMLAPILGFDTQSTRDDAGKLIPDIWDRANKAIRVQGDDVMITLKEPYAPFLNITAEWSMVVSKKFVVQNGGWDGTKGTVTKYNNPKTPEELTLFQKASGTGPFRFVNWDPATGTTVLDRNENYWRAPARLKRVVIQSVENPSTRVLSLRNGDADIIGLSRDELPAVAGLPGVRVVDDLARLATSGSLFFNLKINMEDNRYVGSGRLDGNGVPPDFFADVHVRRAFAHLFDREAFIRDAARGKGRVANGPIPYGMLGYNPKGKWYEVNRDKAIAEFKEALGGQVWERGFKFSLLYNAGNISRQTSAQMVKEAVEATNPKFKVDVQSIGWPAYLSAMQSRKLPIFGSGWLADYADPDNFVFIFMHSSGTFPRLQSYSNPEVDRLVIQAARETDSSKRRQIYFRLQEIAFRDVPTIYVLYSVGFLVSRASLKGWYHNPIFPGWGYLYLMSKD